MNFWTKHQGFKEFVRAQWCSEDNGNPMFTFHQKLKNLKVGLAKWSRDTYGNILQKIATVEIIQAQAIQFEEKPTQVNRINLHKSQADLANYLHLEEEYWRQKSGMKWLTDGKEILIISFLCSREKEKAANY